MSVPKVGNMSVASLASPEMLEGRSYAGMPPLRTESTLVTIQRTAQQSNWVSTWFNQLYNWLSTQVIWIKSWFTPASACNGTLSQTPSTPPVTSSARNMHNLQEFKKALVPEMSAIRIFELFNRVSVRDQNDICKNIWMMEGGANIPHDHPMNRENNYGKAFFKANPHHQVVLAATRAVITSRDYEAHRT